MTAAPPVPRRVIIPVYRTTPTRGHVLSLHGTPDATASEVPTPIARRDGLTKMCQDFNKFMGLPRTEYEVSDLAMVTTHVVPVPINVGIGWFITRYANFGVALKLEEKFKLTDVQDFEERRRPYLISTVYQNKPDISLAKTAALFYASNEKVTLITIREELVRGLFMMWRYDEMPTFSQCYTICGGSRDRSGRLPRVHVDTHLRVVVGCKYDSAGEHLRTRVVRRPSQTP